MPAPSSSLATHRPDLETSLMEFDLEANMGGFIGPQVLRVVDVAREVGNFGKIPLEQLLQQRETKRAPGAGYSRGNWTFEPATYACIEHGAEEPVDDREAAIYADYFDAEMVATLRARSSVMVNAEQRIADAIFDSSAWTGSSLTTAVSNEWDDSSNATPIDDVEAAVQAVYDNSGLWANALVLNRKVFRNLRNCDQVVDRIESSGAGFAARPGDITPQQLAEVFDLAHIIVGGGSYNSANEGQTASVGQIWSDEYAMVCRVAETDDFREPCIGRTFHYAGDGSSPNGMIETYREEAVRSDIVRVRHDVDEVILYKEAGHLLSNITT